MHGIQRECRVSDKIIYLIRQKNGEIVNLRGRVGALLRVQTDNRCIVKFDDCGKLNLPMSIVQFC